MLSVKKIEIVMGWILNFGTILSLSLVIIGGTLYLQQHGSEKVQLEQIILSPFAFHFSQLWQNSLALIPMSIIQLGLLALVATQSLRMVLLVGYYAIIRDAWFTLFSGFILLMLLFSFFKYE